MVFVYFIDLFIIFIDKIKLLPKFETALTY